MDLESWHDFFVAAAGAAAALAGLMVVAISVNIERILQYKPLPARAAAAVGSFVMALVASLTGLVTQPTLAFGVELIAFGCILWSLQFHAIRTGWQSDRMQRRPVYEGVFELLRGQAQVLPFLVAGVLYAVEVDAANYVLLAGILAVFVLSMLDAWILLVEILR
jgi:modulator of FtsH protease